VIKIQKKTVWAFSNSGTGPLMSPLSEMLDSARYQHVLEFNVFPDHADETIYPDGTAVFQHDLAEARSMPYT
jgi:hypothetical protein